jgi:hypothetical protein
MLIPGSSPRPGLQWRITHARIILVRTVIQQGALGTAALVVVVSGYHTV